MSTSRASSNFHLKYVVAAAALALLANAAMAQVRVDDVWARSVVAGQKVTGVFMQLTAAKDAKFLAIESPLAGHAELHEMMLVDGVMKLREVDAIDLPAHQLVELKPGAYHVMLFDLKQRLNPGDEVPLTLTFQDAKKVLQKVTVKATVRNTFAAAGK